MPFLVIICFPMLVMLGRAMLCRHVATALSGHLFGHDALSGLTAFEASIAGVLPCFESVCVSVIRIFHWPMSKCNLSALKTVIPFIFVLQDRASYRLQLLSLFSSSIMVGKRSDEVC